MPLPKPNKLDTDDFLALNAAIGSEPVIAANVTQLCQQANAAQPPSKANVACIPAPASLAANWVRYINLQSVGTPQVRYVALGIDPLWGCSPWLSPLRINCLNNVGQHATRLTQTQYVSEIKQWAQAIHAVDPTIKIGVHLQPKTTICQGSCTMSWDQQVLQGAGSYIDFVMVHQYFLVPQPAANISTATKYSYYQEQQDARVLRGGGATAMPSNIRAELVKWAPAKKGMPIFVTEFNASRNESDDFNTGLQVRSSLYGGIAVGELLLDLQQPVTVNGVRLPGAQRAYLHHLYDNGMLIARYVPIDQPVQTMLFTPGWYILSALKDLAGKSIVKPTLTGIPSTSVGRPALRAFAVISGKDVWLAVFNHSPNQSITADIHLNGTSPQQVSVTQVGKNAASLLSQNTLANPAAITALTSVLPGTMLKSWGIQGFTFAPHNLAVLHIVGN